MISGTAERVAKDRTYKPIRDKVLIEVDPDEKVTAGGIFIPDNKSKDRFTKGTVVDIGGDVKEVSVGEKVAYVRFAGDYYENGKYQMVSEKDIMFAYEGDLRVEEVM